MHFRAINSLLLLLIIGCVNLYLSLKYGNGGYEAFLTACLGLLFLIHWQIFQLLVATKREHGTKLMVLLIPVMGFVWFLLFGALMLCLTYVMPGKEYFRNNVNWYLVWLGAIPYLIPRLYSYDSNTLKSIFIGLSVSLFSVLAALIGTILFMSQPNNFSKIALIFVMELQLVQAFLINKSPFLNYAWGLTHKFSQKFSLSDNASFLILLIIVGAPLLGPIFAMLMFGLQ